MYSSTYAIVHYKYIQFYVSVGTKSQTQAIRNYLVEGKLARQYTYLNFRERFFKYFLSVIIDLVFR